MGEKNVDVSRNQRVGTFEKEHFLEYLPNFASLTVLSLYNNIVCIKYLKNAFFLNQESGKIVGIPIYFSF